jgi:hypothetical protein
MTEWYKLEREIYELAKVIHTNTVALKTKTMSDYDREVLQRHIASRLAQQARLQKQLDRKR